MFTKEPTSKGVDLQHSEAMQWLRDLTLYSGQGYDDDEASIVNVINKKSQ